MRTFARFLFALFALKQPLTAKTAKKEDAKVRKELRILLTLNVKNGASVVIVALVKKLWLITGASVREQARWAKQHLYTLLILSPLVFGMSYMTISRMAEEAPAWQPSLWGSFLIFFTLVGGIIGLSLTRASSEIYHLRRPESVLDALPVSLATHLHGALLKRLTRTAVIAVLATGARALLGAGGLFDAAVLLPFLFFITVTSLAETLSALNWIHWAHTKSRVVALTALLAVIVSAMLAALLLLLIVRPSVLPVWSSRWLIFGGVGWTLALYFLIRMLHERWRGLDIEYAKRLQAGSSLSAFGARVLQKRFERAVAVQLARDLQLTLRAFSSAVYVALFISILLLAALLAVLTTGLLPPLESVPGWFEATWMPSVIAAKIACVLMSATCAMLVAVLVAYQLPYFWLERAAGATGRQMWETKLWYARLVSLPVPLIVWLVSLLSGTVPLFYALPLLAECVWLWWLVSTLFGALAFETPERPELAIVLMISAGATFGLFVSVFWPIGIVLYAMNVIRGISERGHGRANYCLLTEGD